MGFKHNRFKDQPYSDYLVTMVTSVVFLTYISIIFATLLYKWIVGPRPILVLEKNPSQLNQSPSSYHYIVSFVTNFGSKKKMLATVFFQLKGHIQETEIYQVDDATLLENDYHDAFFPCTINYFLVKLPHDLGELSAMEIALENGMCEKTWLLDYCMVRDLQRKTHYYFPVHFWLNSIIFNRHQKLHIKVGLKKMSHLLYDNTITCIRECFLWTCRLTTRHVDLPLDAIANISICYLVISCLMILILFYVKIDQGGTVLFSTSHLIVMFTIVFITTTFTTCLHLLYRVVSIHSIGVLENFHQLPYKQIQNNVGKSFSNNATCCDNSVGIGRFPNKREVHEYDTTNKYVIEKNKSEDWDEDDSEGYNDERDFDHMDSYRKDNYSRNNDGGSYSSSDEDDDYTSYYDEDIGKDKHYDEENEENADDENGEDEDYGEDSEEENEEEEDEDKESFDERITHKESFDERITHKESFDERITHKENKKCMENKKIKYKLIKSQCFELLSELKKDNNNVSLHQINPAKTQALQDILIQMLSGNELNKNNRNTSNLQNNNNNSYRKVIGTEENNLYQQNICNNAQTKISVKSETFQKMYNMNTNKENIKHNNNINKNNNKKNKKKTHPKHYTRLHHNKPSSHRDPILFYQPVSVSLQKIHRNENNTNFNNPHDSLRNNLFPEEQSSFHTDSQEYTKNTFTSEINKHSLQKELALHQSGFLLEDSSNLRFGNKELKTCNPEIEICPKSIQRIMLFGMVLLTIVVMQIILVACGDSHAFKESVYIWMASLLFCFMLQIIVGEPLKVLSIACFWTFINKRLFF